MQERKEEITKMIKTYESIFKPEVIQEFTRLSQESLKSLKSVNRSNLTPENIEDLQSCLDLLKDSESMLKTITGNTELLASRLQKHMESDGAVNVSVLGEELVTHSKKVAHLLLALKHSKLCGTKTPAMENAILDTLDNVNYFIAIGELK